MTSRSVTVIDVARAAGVSKSTASDALAGGGRVAEATRERVRRAAEELGYRPNSAARRLRSSSTGALGLYLPQTASRLDYYMHFAFGAAGHAQQDGYDLVLLAPGSGTRLASRVDGVILADPVLGDPSVPGLLEAGVPVVTGERYLGGGTPPGGSVVCDNAASLTALLHHLHERGARHPALLAPEATSEWAAGLRGAFTDWGAGRGIGGVLRTVDFAATEAEARRATAALLADEPGVDAVICAPDGAAAGVLGAAATAGRRVGDDLLVASCVDGPSLRATEPPVTAVDLRPAQYGQACAALLHDLLTGAAPVGTVRQHSWSLEIRASTAGR